MTSSSAGTRRYFLRRPKVCKASPNPGRCHPPPPPPLPPRVCNATLEQDSEESGDHFDLLLTACCDALPFDQVVNWTATITSDGVVEPVGTVNNCDPGPETVDGDNPTTEGEFTIDVTFVWSDGGTCSTSVTGNVEPEE